MARVRGRSGRAAQAAALTILAAALMAPLAFTFLYSFFPPSEISSFLLSRGRYDDSLWMPFLLTPALASLKQYYRILIEDLTVLNYFVNSAMYMAGILLGQALIVPAMAYALTKFRYRGREALFFAVVVLMVRPFQVTMMPNVITLNALRLMDTPWAVILPMWFSPFYIFLLRQFMVGVPDELLEAASIDGAGPMRAFLNILLPACRPVLGAAVALSFADSWNLVEQPLVYLASRADLYPLSVMFNQIATAEKGAEVAFAGASIYILPALLVYRMFQDDIMAGVHLSELK
ncbi:MAG: carbohydrate ABC transporter permease [Clostridiales bacterium]|nr:carbohydrate ABC transporter permease [Clostridiales bacterium]